MLNRKNLKVLHFQAEISSEIFCIRNRIFIKQQYVYAWVISDSTCKKQIKYFQGRKCIK